jgi:hypothetical protein
MLNLLHKTKPEPPVARLIELIITLAADQHATKILLGEPSEVGCQRIHLDPTAIPACPWEEEDRARFCGDSETNSSEKTLLERFLTNDPVTSKRKPCHIPLWFKVGETFLETSFLPAIMFVEMVQVIHGWNQCAISCEKEDMQADKPSGVRVESTDEAVLSDFQLKLRDGRVIHASFGFESDFRLSITLHEDGKKIKRGMEGWLN